MTPIEHLLFVVVLFVLSAVAYWLWRSFSNRESRLKLAQSQKDLQSEVRSRLKVQKALRAAEDKYRAIFQFAMEGISVTTMKGKPVSVNPAYARMLGYDTPEELINSVDDMASQIYVNSAERERFLALIRNFGVAKFKFQAKRKDGKKVWLSVSARGLKDEAGEFSEIESITEDVTQEYIEQQLLSESEGRLRLALEASHMGIWDWDMATNSVVCSPMCARLMGLPEHKPRREPQELLQTIPPTDLSMLQAVLDRAVQEKGEYEAEYRVRWPDQSIHWLAGRGKVFSDEKGEPVRVVGTIVDITEEKRIEEERSEVETALKRHADELARSNRELEQFAYVSSHDLKEPLRMVNVFVGLLSRQLDGKLDGEALEYMNYVMEGAQRMQSLINDLLNYSRVGKELNAFKPVDCNDALNHALTNLQDAVKESGAQIRTESLPTVYGYSTQLIQLFQNLIGNAIKFRGDGELVVSVGAERCGREWKFWVRDNGIGISDRYLNKIFVVFQRLHNPGRYPGTGIGLSICKKIVENHSGQIWADSELGQGSTFYFTLPDSETLGAVVSQ